MDRYLVVMLGAAFGGLLLDHISVAATLIGGTLLLVLAAQTVGNGNRIRPDSVVDAGSNSGFIEVASAACECETGN